MKPLLIVTITCVILIIIWIVVSYRVDTSLSEPSYVVVEKKDSYEIRRYDPYLIATVVVDGDSYRDRTNKAFGLLANYIFGGNSTKTSIEMTTPVQTKTDSVKIEMTTPVVTEQNGSQLTMSFVLPERFTLENVPKPLIPEITLTQKPVTITATKGFSGLAGEEKSNKQKETLMDAIAQNNLEPTSAPQILQYNQPWIFPWARRNEVSVEIKG